MPKLISAFIRNESGATTIEYGLIATFIAVVCVLALTSVGTKANKKFTSVSTGLS